MGTMKFSIPSVDEIVERSIRVASRFPFVLVAAVVATISAVWFSEIEFERTKDYYWLSDIIFVSVLGISLFASIQTLSESLRWQKSLNLLAKFIGLILLVSYYFVPEGYITEGANETFYRYFVLFLISHLFVAISPFLKNPNMNEFWGYNKTLFLNFLISALYSAVLFFGLSIALLSIDNLLGFDIKDVRYLQLWFILVGIFNTVFFLARVPKISEFEPSVTEYPKALKVFVQYVLIPIVSIYILILYSYLIKILIQWELPTGWVANLVLSFSIAGIFSLLLLHPIKDEAKNNWIRLYSKLYYIGLVPLVILLFVSIGTRISEYGVTINRFYVATLAVWLAGIVIYFIVSKSKNIKVIPISLALIGLGITFGPLSAFSVSERSQKGRITEILKSNGLLDSNEKVIIDTTKVPVINKKEFSSLVEYLVSNHGVEAMQSFFDKDISAIVGGDHFYVSDAEKISNAMGIEYLESWEKDEVESTKRFSFSIVNNEPINIESFDYMIGDLNFYSGYDVFLFEGEFDFWKISYDMDNDHFNIQNTKSGKNILIKILPLIETLKAKSISLSQKHSASSMRLEKENDNLKVMIQFFDLEGTNYNETEITRMKFMLFIKQK